jgi:hypothetical protein
MSVEYDAKHHLVQLWPEVLGEAAPAKRGAASALEPGPSCR